jgi:hypothetical protein
LNIMEKWRRVWREGMVPYLSRRGMQALETALVQDDPRLLQGTICTPPLLDALRERKVEGTCAIGFCGWQGEGLDRVGQIEEYFHQVCDAAEAACNELAACRHFLNWFDEVPRDVMRRELLAEVRRALCQPLSAAA